MKLKPLDEVIDFSYCEIIEQPSTRADLDLKKETITIMVSFRARLSTQPPPNEECRKAIPITTHKAKIRIPIIDMWMVAEDNEDVPTKII